MGRSDVREVMWLGSHLTREPQKSLSESKWFRHPFPSTRHVPVGDEFDYLFEQTSQHLNTSLSSSRKKLWWALFQCFCPNLVGFPSGNFLYPFEDSVTASCCLLQVGLTSGQENDKGSAVKVLAGDEPSSRRQRWRQGGT